MREKRVEWGFTVSVGYKDRSMVRTGTGVAASSD